jgi:hypothetical protein
MDYGKHVTSANNISLAIIALGFTALYAVWITSEIEKTLRLYNYFEHILVARNTLMERPWNDGAEVTLASLIEIKDMHSFVVKAFVAGCENNLFSSCEDERTQRERLFGHTLKEMQLKLPRTRRVEVTGVRSEYAGSCSAIFFRGKDDEMFWIHGISDTVAVYERKGSLKYSSTPGTNQVQGSFIYYVRLSDECRFSSFLGPPFSFFLIDLRSIGKGWNFYAPENVIRAVYNELGYRMKMSNFMETEDWRKATFPDASFETDRFFEQLPASYREYFANSVPSKFLTLPVAGIESRIIGTAYIKTGTLYNSSEIDKAISAVYSYERLSPTVGGVGTNLHLFISIAPIILLGFSFFFWYHVKRIVRSDSPYNDPWIFLDAEGLIEKGFVAVWATLLVLTPASITWALLVTYNVSLPPIWGILAWVGLNKNPLWQEILQEILEDSVVSVPATLGGFVVVAGALLIIHSLHLLLKRGVVTYNHFCTSIKSWFVRLVRRGP